MGLDTSHWAWNGPYSAFQEWRACVAAAAGYGNYSRGSRALLAGEPPTQNLDWEKFSAANLAGVWEQTPSDPLVILLAHSDSDGSILPQHTEILAARLEELLPRIQELAVGALSDCYDKTLQFIDGLRLAAEFHEPVTFG